MGVRVCVLCLCAHTRRGRKGAQAMDRGRHPKEMNLPELKQRKREEGRIRYGRVLLLFSFSLKLRCKRHR